MSASGSEISEKMMGELARGEGGAEGEEGHSSPNSEKTYNFSIWPDGPDFTYDDSGEWHMSFRSSEYEGIRGEAEDRPYHMYVPEGEGSFKEEEEEEEETEEEEEEEEEEERVDLKDRKQSKKRRDKSEKQRQDTKSKSLFVHSLPSQFPDVTKIRKSAFGSIFLRTSSEVSDELTLLRTIADNSYVLISSLLDSFEAIIADASNDPERRRFTVYFKESLQKTLEAHGMSKTYSDGSVHWDIYPITQGYLFSVHLKNRLHQTRDLTKVEQRIVKGPTRVIKFPFSWPTRSIWSGYWDSLGMTSSGIYSMPHGVSYFGKLQDGMFHDTNATLTYPNKFKALHCVFEKGKLLSCQFQFPDMLVYEDDWKYCKFPDRRFWSEVHNGLKSAKIAQKTQVHPPRSIPQGCYDAGDGFYNPKTLMLESPSGKLLRVPLCDEDLWIKKYCRKGFFEYSNYRPDLFENWFNYDQERINSILNHQAAFRAGKITYNDLQQFYADMDLLPTFLPFKKRKSPAEAAYDEFYKTIPEPKVLTKRKALSKYGGHKISRESTKISNGSHADSKASVQLALEEPEESATSKISFKESKIKSDTSDTVSETGRRKIPEKYLEYRPLFKLPFERRRIIQERKCIPRKTSGKSSSTSSEIFPPPEGASNAFLLELERKNLEKFMKSIIMDAVTDFLIEERQKLRERYVWGQKFPSRVAPPTENKTLTVLKQLFNSIPDKDEFCDWDPKKICDLKEFAKDKHDLLRYWGNRILTLDFNDKPMEGLKPKIQELQKTADVTADLLFDFALKKNLKVPQNMWYNPTK